MHGSLRFCPSCAYWEPDGAGGDLREGLCRRFPPVGGPAQGAGAGQEPGVGQPRTREGDWCGEWERREAPLADEEDRWLRNSSMAQALLTLPEDKRDRLLREVLSEEEREGDRPPDDFYERVQDYFARRRGDAPR